MTCSSCGADNDAGRKFCMSCGERLSVACAACGTPNTPDARFCGECGAGLGGAETPAAVPIGVPSTERRLVSVLFADLVGFTTLSEARDAEDVRELLADYFETCRAVVDRYGGTVEKFIGDAVMAVWGTPTAQEDDAERAVRAALDLVDAVRRLATERETPDLALRAAVHTGEAVVTIGASGMGMVAGDLVNTASRLQSIALPGTVLVGEGTQRAASTAIAFEPAGDQDLKGKSTPVPAFRAVRVVAQRGGVGRSDALEPPFVGRDAEHQLIKDFYQATARDRGPRLVSVIGQAGIGKSRLAWEFLKYIDGVAEVVYWHQGRSPAYGEGISFWALGEMVRMRIGTEDDATEGATREALAASLAEFVPDADERRDLEAPLLHLLGVGDSAGHERGQLFGAWRTFFERIADVAPVVMVFEDLQWADDGLLDFIEDLMAWSRGHSIYVITLARPELIDRRPNWGAGQRSFTSLNLAPLGDESMHALLAGLVPGLPDALIAQIVARAEGIPLYAVETVRTLLNDGRIERQGEAFAPVGDLTTLAVPESLHALIAARIDALPGAERTLVQDASVLGLSFADAALRAVVRSAPDEIDQMLRHLVQRELMTLETDPRSPERGQYRFVQGLLREVAYATLSRDDRRARHLAAARYYEALGDDELSGVLAQHYVDAYESHPDGPEGAAVAAQARVALRAAAQRAADLGSHRLAHAYMTSALSITKEPADELDLRTIARNAANAAGMLDVAADHGERAIALARDLGLDAERRLGIAAMGDVLIEGHQQRAHALLTEALAEPGLTPQAPGWIEMMNILAKAEMRMLNDPRAIELADEALPEAERVGDAAIAVDLLITRGVALVNGSRPTEALITLRGALETARRLGSQKLIGRASINLGYGLAHQDLAAAFEVMRDALVDARKAGQVSTIRYLLGNMVDSAIELGEWDWALEAIDEHEHLLNESVERLWFGSFRLAIAAMRGEDIEAEARRLLKESEAYDDPQFRSVGAYPTVILNFVRGELPTLTATVEQSVAFGLSGIDATIVGARLAIWQGDVATARRMHEAHGAQPPSSRRDGLMAAMDGGIAMLEGRPADANVGYADALRTFRDHRMLLWTALTDLDIVITGALDLGERARAAEEAREIFTRLRATPFLDRLDRALAEGRDRTSTGRLLQPSPEGATQEA